MDLRTVIGVVDEWELQCLYSALESQGISVSDVQMGENDCDMYATVIVFVSPSRRDLLMDKWREFLMDN